PPAGHELCHRQAPAWGPPGGDPASRTDVRPGRDGPAEACAATMNNDPPKIYIVGIGGDGLAGLPSRAPERVAGAGIRRGSDAAVRLLPEVNAERVRIGSDLGEVTEKLRTQFGKKRIVVVATGDPLFYGVARYLCDRLGKERFEVLPHVSSMQLAFARVKE